MQLTEKTRIAYNSLVLSTVYTYSEDTCLTGIQRSGKCNLLNKTTIADSLLLSKINLRLLANNSFRHKIVLLN